MSRIAAVVFVLCVVPAAARGYTVLRTNADRCGHELPLHWKQIPIPFYVDTTGTPDLSLAAVEDTVATAFAAWERAGIAHARFEYRGTYDAPLGVTVSGPAEPRYGIYSVARNVVGFQQENWPIELHGVRGITFALYHLCSGQILQTDIIMNDTYTDWYADGVPGGCDSCFDLLGLMTHEAGHLIGVGHSGVPDTTMNICDQPESENPDCWCVRAGQTCGRSLEADDLAALVFLYPPDEAPAPSTYAGAVGDECRHPGDCASEICVPIAVDHGVCTASCDVDGDCPDGFECIEPPAGTNPDGNSVCAKADVPVAPDAGVVDEAPDAGAGENGIDEDEGGSGCAVASTPDGQPIQTAWLIALVLMAVAGRRRDRRSPQAKQARGAAPLPPF